MKKKKKGFTLTELIAVIVILALIMLIGIPAYNSIRKRTLETQYQNTVKLIETAAEKYASNTGNSVTLVQNLIEAGLIETDDGERVLDPRNKKSLNCYPIEIEYSKGKYKARYIDEEVVSCKVEDAIAKYGDISIERYNIISASWKTRVSSGSWSSRNNELKVKFNDESLASQEGLKYNWVTSSGQTSSDQTITISTNTVYNGTVNVQVTDKNNNRYFASTIVRIDKEKPIIKDISVSCNGDCNNGRTVTIKATDKNGSGVDGYYVGTSTCNNSVTFVNSNKIDLSLDEIKAAKPNNDTPATYNVCVKDKVGNISAEEQIKVDTKDITPPECKWSGEANNDTDWAKSRTIRLSCDDNESGCHTDYDSMEWTINDTNSVITTKSLSYTIKDNAGNETTCTKDVNVYVDTKAPEIPIITHIYDIWGSHSPDAAHIYGYKDNVGTEGIWETTNSDPQIPFYNINSLGNISGAYVELDSALTKDIYVQVFYATSSQYFSESYSKTVTLKAGETKAVLPFSSTGNYTNFRFDIGTTSGLKYKIKSLGLISSERDWWKDYRYIRSISTDEGSGISAWYWKDNKKTTWQEAGTTRVSNDKSEYISIWKAEFDRTVKFKVCDRVGNCKESSQYKAGVDKTSPAKPSLSNASGGNWINKSFNISARSSDANSGISKWYWKDNLYTKSWTEVTNASELSANKNTYNSSWSAEGDRIAHFKACDKVGNCSEEASTAVKIDKTPPSIWKSSWDNSTCLNYYKSVGTCASNATRCLEIGYDDNYTPSNEIKVAYSICIEGYSTGKTYDVKCVDGFTAYDRLNYYVNNGTCKGAADLYNNKCYKTWAEKAITVYNQNGYSYAGLCTSYGDRTTQYAYRACDLAGNCSAIGTSSR